MIDIINGYSFKRNFNNTVLISLSNVAFYLDVQPYLIKEHYYICVADRCFSEGEIHHEEIEHSSVEAYIPCKSLEYLINSLKHEKVAITNSEKEASIHRVLDVMIETQNIVSECFSHDCYDYSDPVRKINSSLPDISQSVSSISDDELLDTDLN